MINDETKILSRVIRDVSQDTYGKFIVQPLKRGFGTTLGNALRRVLLTSIPGSAITSVKVDGILHEFSSIPGVTEDMAEIILNLKQISLKYDETNPEPITLKFQGKGEFKAGDIAKADPLITIINPDLYICTMNEKADFSMGLTIGSGSSWVPADKNQTIDFPVGTIFIDSIFSPIESATFRVENLPGTSRGEVLERLELIIKTDGTWKAEEALDYASNLLQRYFAIFSEIQATAADLSQESESEDVLKIRRLLTRSVDEMELSVRSYNCLKANNIKTIWQLVDKEEAQMLKFKNFGRKSLNELMAKLKIMDLEFGMDVSKYLSEEDS